MYYALHTADLKARPGARLRAMGLVTGAPGAAPLERLPGGVALLHVRGAIAARESGWFAEVNAREVAQQMRSLAGEARGGAVRRVVLAIDSPGGEVAAADELAAGLAALKDAGVPVTALIDSAAYSLAAMLALACDEVVIGELGAIGSLGAYAMLEDVTAELAQMGIKIEAVVAPEQAVGLKGQGPLTGVTDRLREDARAALTAAVGVLTARVAAGRRVDVARAAEWFTAQTWVGQQALDAGLVDRVASVPAELEALRKGQIAKGPNGQREDTSGAEKPEEHDMGSDKSASAGVTGADIEAIMGDHFDAKLALQLVEAKASTEEAARRCAAVMAAKLSEAKAERDQAVKAADEARAKLSAKVGVRKFENPVDVTGAQAASATGDAEAPDADEPGVYRARVAMHQAKGKGKADACYAASRERPSSFAAHLRENTATKPTDVTYRGA
jgi:ClpP class serine protease